MHFRTAEGERQSSAEGDPGCGAGQAGAGAGGEEARGGDQEGRQDGQQAGRHRPRQAAHQRQETENKDIQYDQQGKEKLVSMWNVQFSCLILSVYCTRRVSISTLCCGCPNSKFI